MIENVRTDKSGAKSNVRRKLRMIKFKIYIISVAIGLLHTQTIDITCLNMSEC